MDQKRTVRISKFLSLHLRHEPGRIGLALEPGGWVAVDDLLAGMRREGHEFFVSANGVWLVDNVPPSFLRLF